ncbi:hypothetical protein [Sphingomonas oryzagri]|uniref:TniQ protein n=1 Tax=Sphingomonas oryzagri TaxID=3042314 RepID=A0ABT6N3T1_9SPHN|nr:hypothetical protein [Sphingomonas oryzagri]MDH7639955.1 hypothetical protein [Sphingomonas oryzagri]
MVTAGIRWNGTVSSARLSLPTVPRDGESLIGLVARATRRNVLANTRIVTSVTGAYLFHPGHVVVEPGDWSVALARVVGCSPAEVEARRVGNEQKPDPHAGARIPTPARSHLELHRRRVSPVSLAESGHHRTTWLYRHLPYCPESLELLIDRCSDCGTVQGWSEAWGIGNCDNYECRRPLVAPEPRFLPRRLEASYRRFASMLDPDPSVRASTLAAMPTDFAEASCRIQVQSLVLLGSLFVRGVPANIVGSTNARGVVHLPPEELAEIVCTGVDLLGDWPRRLRGEVVERLSDGRLSDLSAAKRFSKGYRRLSVTTTKSSLYRMFEAGLPETRDNSHIALAALGRRTFNARDAARITGISTIQFARLRNTGRITPIVASSEPRGARFDAHEIELISNLWRGSDPWTFCATYLKIPVYGIEQLAALGELAYVDHPVIHALDPEPRLLKTAVAGIRSRFAEVARTEAPPSGLVPLHLAMRCFARMKPWGHVLSMILADELPCWIPVGRSFDARHALVDPCRIAGRPDLQSSSDNLKLFPRIMLTTSEACDILMVGKRELDRAVAMGLVRLSRHSPKKTFYDRAQILRLSETIMPWPMVKQTVGLLPRNVLAATGVNLANTFPIGLPREDVLAGRLPVIKVQRPQWPGRRCAVD